MLGIQINNINTCAHIVQFGHVILGWGYTHDRRADKYPYPHNRRADKDSYTHDRNVTDDLCNLIELCFAFIMVNFST